MSGEDGKLGNLMGEWKAVEPGPGFEQGVWARIDAAGAQPVDGNVITFPLFSKAVAAGIAAVLAITAGVLAGLLFEPAGLNVSGNLFTSLPRTSVSASFLSMNGGNP